MLRGNLSSRPFYNERLVSLTLVAVALVAVLLAGFNGTRLMTLSGQRQELERTIQGNRDEAAQITTQATALRATVADATLTSLAASTRQANDLIDARTFSWTSFFGLIERTLPIDVRLVAVSPRVERGVFRVSMMVVGRDLADVDAFMDALSTTGKFYDVAPASQSLTEEDTYTAVINAAYLPTPPAAPAAGAKR